MFSTTGQVLAEEAEGQDTLQEEGPERRPMRVRVLCPFRGRREVRGVHRARAKALQCQVRLVRLEAEAVLRQP
jgi:hypothetical protein